MAKLGSFQVVNKAIAAAQGPIEPDTFEFEGKEYRVIQTTPSALPLMQFAAAMSAADEDDDSVSMDALGAMYQMLRYCVDTRDWSAFERAAMKAGAGIDDLLPITQAVWQSVTARPTAGPSDLPGGPSRTATGTSSKGDSRSRKDRRSKRERRIIEGSATTAATETTVTVGPWPAPPGRPDLAVPLISVDEALRQQSA